MRLIGYMKLAKTITQPIKQQMTKANYYRYFTATISIATKWTLGGNNKTRPGPPGLFHVYFKKHCQDEDVKRLNVSVLAANKAAVNFYNSVGFQTRTLNFFQEL